MSWNVVKIQSVNVAESLSGTVVKLQIVVFAPSCVCHHVAFAQIKARIRRTHEEEGKEAESITLRERG